MRASSTTVLLAATLASGCGHRAVPPPGASGADAAGVSLLPRAGTPCGPLDCRQYDSLEEAFESALEGRPRLVAVGEAHAQKGTTVPSAARRFTERVLPRLAGRASDLLVELMNPPAGCAKTTDVVRKQQAVVTRDQAPTDQGEYVAMGERARQLGIVPDLLRPSCADLDAVKAAGDDAIVASLALIARLTRTQAEKLLDRDARTPADADRFVVTYGGAIHNDPEPPPERADWSFGPQARRPRRRAVRRRRPVRARAHRRQRQVEEARLLSVLRPCAPWRQDHGVPRWQEGRHRPAADGGALTRHMRWKPTVPAWASNTEGANERGRPAVTSTRKSPGPSFDAQAGTVGFQRM